MAAPKASSRQTPLTSPPPAYTPRTAPDLAAQMRQQLREPFIMGRPSIPETVLEALTTEDEDDQDQEEGISPISLRINTSVLISKNNNLVCLTDTPASHANAIARAVVKAIQENSSGQCGIPMIDEDGRPRPVKIEVDAGITVEGSGNIVGNEAIMNEVLRQRSLTRKRAADFDDDESDVSALPTKQRRGSGSTSSISP
ncbi:hypothetical protein BBK36DRAFT_57422 [Trichoderma citrinoviride]|uniref:Uncharacterized protein n=1 Tax=Trichoderma citrinoviride TaxID=58853 RepID=A0A2T4B542_9HYPO|nr:hypothetical protein BBK36DRAFT_57422 [Trichoderma citrinoviride]PTB64453.1 hypothetical protein BBK36DRAFT_57422 [Trichoderma citrinoviride]